MKNIIRASKNLSACHFGHACHRFAIAVLDSVDTEEEAIQLARDVHFIHSQGGFVMRNWVSNSKTVLDALETQAKDISLSCERELATEKVLGMWWSTGDDTLVFKISNRYNNNEVLLGKRRPTKREVLSLLMTVFDPLGLLGFFIMYAKIVFQEIWRSGCAWDELIHDHEHIKWLHWLQFLPEVSSMKIPRCYVKTNFKGTPEFEIHTFVDASEDGYAAVCYLRSTDGIFVDCALLGSKTRVAPLKLMSIPRLELQAAVIGARLAKSLVGSLSIDIVKQTFWSDSRTVLSWLRSDHRRYKQFVAFRVSEILELSEVSDWRWIPTSENVADEATKWQRTPDFSENSRWLNGPAFLKFKEIDWPIENCKGNERTDEELRVQYIGYHNDDSMVVERTICVEAERFSSWTKLLNVLSTVVNFSFYWKDKAKDNIQLKHNPSVKSQTVKRRPISQSDIQIAEITLLKKAQMNRFMDEILQLSKGNQIKKCSSIYKLSPYLDTNGLMRIGGRVSLKNGQDPIILPKCEHITELIVKFYHSKYYHCNHETVVNEIRQKFWIPRLRTVLHRVRRICQYCKNRSAKPFPPKMACLPKARLASFCRPFTYVGVDYFGPLLVSVRRSNEKRYGVLLTCLTTRAIHIEIAYSLSTDSCIIAIRNFIARRGCPIELWSDNGTNFKGAERELREEFKLVDKSRLARAITNSSTKWNFIPPSSPHMGGAWERLVRSVKDVLRRIMPSRNPTDELLRGMLMEIELIVNSRPLTYIPIDHEEDEALTPNHFLLGSSSGAKPLGIEEAEGVHLRRSWKITQQLANTFWKRWVTEYLPIITRRCKWFDDVKPIEVDDIVFIVDPDNPRLSWPKGRVVAVNLGVDGRVRSASVKTSTGVYERPATKIAVLDVSSPKCAEIGPPEDLLGGSVAKNHINEHA